MPKFRLGATVTILASEKSDGRFNKGKIIGIEATTDNLYLGYVSKKEFLSRFTVFRYKLAYIDCFTKRAGTDWFSEAEISNAM